MKAKQNGLLGRYRTALRQRLEPAARADAGSAKRLGSRALAEGLDAAGLAAIHEQALIEVMSLDGASAGSRSRMLKGACKFFAEAIAPIEGAHRAAAAASLLLNRRGGKMNNHANGSAPADRRLEREIVRRKAVEISLRISEARYSELLTQSHRMQGQLKHLSHQILQAQEEERKEISRELHDQIAQTLTGINVHLAALKQEDAINTKGLAKKIVSTQRLVEKSVNIVHRFARDLRPTILDDLGLIPALQSYVKDWAQRTGIPVRFTAIAGVEGLGGDKRTTLYRVAQAALTNIAQHAGASDVSLCIRKVQAGICMEIHDNGKSFDVERVLFAKRHKRLGVLGMRERVEMVGGVFTIESAPGKGTLIQARIPSRR